MTAIDPHSLLDRAKHHRGSSHRMHIPTVAVLMYDGRRIFNDTTPILK